MPAMMEIGAESRNMLVRVSAYYSKLWLTHLTVRVGNYNYTLQELLIKITSEWSVQFQGSLKCRVLWREFTNILPSIISLTQFHQTSLEILIKPGGIVRWMMIIIEPDNNQQMDHEKWCTCRLTSKQVSVLRSSSTFNEAWWDCEGDDAWWSLFKILFIVYSHKFNEPWNWSNHSVKLL